MGDASVVDDAASVIARVFDEAERGDPDHAHPWVALVDGNNHQIDRLEAEAGSRGIEVTVLVDSSMHSSTSGHVRRLPARQGGLPRLPDRPVEGVADRNGGDRRLLPLRREGQDGHHRRPLGLDGAEAVLNLRALRANDCWDNYWSLHLAQERKRVHESRYLDGVLPTAA